MTFFLCAEKRRRAVVLAVGLGLLVGAEAEAVVIQINGTTVPTQGGGCPGSGDNCLQSGLNIGEGFAVNANTNPLDAQQDAATIPELFTVPKNSSGNFRTVTFYYLMHGAGYNNAFGWYNADDPATRYQVFVGTEKANNSVPTMAITQTVNFQTLCNPNAGGVCQGTYHGGAIGFYLRVPNDNNRVYFTQKELNADGNYIHFLVYPSLTRLDATTGQPLAFYFGFEDLYRGGDNDFDDSAFLVEGLVVPCQRMAEICDGLDNDCDGAVDNVDYSALPPCFPPGYPPGRGGVGICTGGNWICTQNGSVFQDTCVGAVLPSTTDYCDGLDNDCDGSTDEGGIDPATNINNVCPADALAGECDASLVCLTGTVACQVNVGPAAEICDNRDNDCDGATDEIDDLVDTGLLCNCTGRVDQNLNMVPSGQPCAGPSVGECRSGQTQCLAGGLLSCVGYAGPSPEVCDNKDNNCNGQIDEGLTGLGTCNPTTPSGVFVCSPGTRQCINGVIVCTGYELGSPERCNGQDDDCDGTPDNNPIDVGLPCGNTLGICTAGTTACVNGSVACTGIGQGPENEVCDGQDNDCDGAIDEHSTADPLPGVGSACQDTPQCRGTRACINGTLECVVNTGSIEICDGIDNDCDGTVDNDPVDVGGVCSTSITQATGNVGECEFGTLICDPVTHRPVCTGEIGPVPEVCNGKDDDCNTFIDDDRDGTGSGFVLGGDSGGRTVLVGEACGAGAEGGNPGCLAGAFTCQDGVMVCDTESTVRVEVCNGIDDDCDGAVDENTPTEPLPRVGDACGSAFPPCQPGALACVSGQLECEGETTGTVETCNGIDDDCDGIVDNPPSGGFQGDGDECAAPGVSLPIPANSLCRAGEMRCYEGQMQCIGAVGPFAQERCNGIDDTCDGLVDDGAACPTGTGCHEGACRKPCADNEFTSCPGGLDCILGFCVPTGAGTGGAGGGGLGGGAGAGLGGGSGTGPDGGAGETGGAGGTGDGPDGGFGASNGEGASASAGGSGNGNDPSDDDSVWGQATGGGGLHCAASGGAGNALGAFLVGLAAALFAARRRRPGSGEVAR